MSTETASNESNVSRRGFMKKAATVAAGAALAGGAAKAQVYKSILPSSILGANEKILTGHIGIGGMGRSNLGFVLQRSQKEKDMEPIALCDLYDRNLQRAVQMTERVFPNCSQHHDFREIIDNKDVDAVVISTPDHWHCLCTLYAADAKKDIYCEKPLSTTIEEGRAMVEAVRRNNVIFQGGNMQRSGEHFQEAVALIKNGHIGKISRVETYIHDDEKITGIGMGEDDMSKYPGCDWEFHQGWVEHRPFNTNRWIYNFRWFLDYSGGKITDWGAHLLDIALLAMGEFKPVKSVVATGNKFIMQDNRTTPDTLEVLWEFDDYVLSFSNRVYNSYLPEGYQSHGIIFHGTLGTLRVDRSGFVVKSVSNNEGCEEIKKGGSLINEPHWGNFCQCIRERKDPVSSVEKLEYTTQICHMGTCSYVADGAKLHWDSENVRFKGEGEAVKKANEWAYRPYLNGWSLKAPYRIA